jgi:hypothetical protein
MHSSIHLSIIHHPFLPPFSYFPHPVIQIPTHLCIHLPIHHPSHPTTQFIHLPIYPCMHLPALHMHACMHAYIHTMDASACIVGIGDLSTDKLGAFTYWMEGLG